MKAGRNSAEFVITDWGCWVRASGREFTAVPDQGWNPARYLGEDMVLAGAPLRPIPVRSALEQLVSAGLGRSAKSIDHLNVVHPTHWGSRRIRQFEEVGTGLGFTVSGTPFAAVVARRRGGSGVTLVVEAGELATCASVVGSDGRIYECRYEPGLGTADVAEAPDQVARFADLFDRPGIDQVVVTGPDVAELPRIAEQANRSEVIVGPGPAALEPRAEPDGTLKARIAGVPRGWWFAAAAFAVAIVIAAVFVVVRPGSDAHDTPQTIAFGRAELVVPPGWTWQERPQSTPEQRRIDLSLAEHNDRRIILTQNSVPESTTLEDAKRSLRRQIAPKSETFSDLEDVVYAGRQTIFYTENPAGDDSQIRWYTMIDRGVQTSVGCQFRPGVWDDIAAVCEQVVASVDVTH